MKKNQEQSIAISDDEPILVLKNRDSLISSTTKINDDCDYS